MQKFLLRTYLALFLVLTQLSFANFVGLELLKKHKNTRYETFQHLFEILSQTKPKIIVETGTSRQGVPGYWMDGASTLLFTEFAKKMGCQFYSVDISAESIATSKAACIQMFGKDISTQFIVQDSVEFLSQFSHKIDCLYLDSFDFESNNPVPSQAHHLKEIMAAYPHLSRNCVIMIDDCQLPHGGKGAKVIPWLEAKGWKVIHKAYQVILIRE